jgi:hypothetical protein
LGHSSSAHLDPNGVFQHAGKLRGYTSEADGVFMRRILEHNRDWPKILSNAVNSFQKRMVLIIFTPFPDETRQMDTTGVAVPDISFRKEDLTTSFKRLV